MKSFGLAYWFPQGCDGRARPRAFARFITRSRVQPRIFFETRTGNHRQHRPLETRERERERGGGREMEYYPVEMLTSSETRPAPVPGLPPCGGKFHKVHAGGKLYAIHCTPWAWYRLELVENFRATDFFGAPCARQNEAHPVASDKDQRNGCSVLRVRVPLSRGTFRCILTLRHGESIKLLLGFHTLRPRQSVTSANGEIGTGLRLHYSLTGP